MIAALLAVLVVLLIGGAASIVIMRTHGDPRRGAALAASRSIDPFAVNEPWRRFVQDALRAQ